MVNFPESIPNFTPQLPTGKANRKNNLSLDKVAADLHFLLQTWKKRKTDKKFDFHQNWRWMSSRQKIVFQQKEVRSELGLVGADLAPVAANFLARGTVSSTGNTN